jgi:hypothetical protein
MFLDGIWHDENWHWHIPWVVDLLPEERLEATEQLCLLSKFRPQQHYPNHRTLIPNYVEIFCRTKLHPWLSTSMCCNNFG